jgi:zinc transport system ATP-binding protein
VRTLDHGVNVVEVKDVSFAYGATEVFRDVNLQIHRGDYLGLAGPNGSGKTTLLRIVLGLLPPTSGSVRLFGAALCDFTDWSRVGYVPQKATHFDENFPATAEEVVLMGRFGRRGLFRRMQPMDRAKAREALEHVNLSNLSRRLIGDLSGGQQQRVFIARALASEPDILLLDEPTVGVDAQTKEEFYALLRTLNRDLHLTVVLITHDLESLAQEAMHVACLDRTLFYHESAHAFLAETPHQSTVHRHH